MAEKQSTPLEKAARLLDLVPYISTHQGVAISELAAEFEVSENELLSDLNTLWMCGLPGYTPLELIDLEFDSGFVSIRNAEILQKVRVLTKDELVVLLVGLDILNKSIDPQRSDLHLAISALQSKIKGLIGDVAAITPIVDSALRAIILKAITNRKMLEISYHSLIRDSVGARKVTPIELTVDHGYEVLQAYCHLAGAYRTFRLDNVKEAVISDEISRREINPQSEVDLQMEIKISGRLRTTLERFRIVVDPEISLNSERFTATSFSQDWLIRNAMSTLGVTEVLAPDTARTEVADRCRKTLNLYESDIFGNS